MDDARDVEERQNAEDLLVVLWSEREHLQNLGNGVLVGNHDGFWQACCARREAEEGADVPVLLVLRDTEVSRLSRRPVAFAKVNQVPDGGVASELTFQQEDMLFWDSDVAGCLCSNIYRCRVRGDELGLGGAQSIGHFLDIVGGRCPRDYSSDTYGSEQGDGVPDGVSAEERQCLLRLEAILADESGGDVGCILSDLAPRDTLIGDGVTVASEVLVGMFSV